MSDYVRIKAIRYKINQDLVKEIEKEIEEKDLYESPEEVLSKKYELQDYYENKINEFAINSGYNFKTEENDLFIDYLLDYEHGASGDFESVRTLTDNEFNKYKEKFSKFFDITKRDEIRLVHYCYYNGVDSPSVWELEEV